MDRTRSHVVGISVLAMLLASLLAVAPAGASTSPTIDVTSSVPFGQFGGVDYSRHDCRFSGTADAFAYTRTDGTSGGVAFDVFCSIVLPDDADDWNGRILVEPVDAVAPEPPLGEFNREILLTDEFLFGLDAPGNGQQRWGYASISYFSGIAGDFIDQPVVIGPLGPEVPAAGLEIIADFSDALRTTGGSPHGAADVVAATGFSNQATAIRGTMALWATFGAPIFDAALVMATAGHLEIDPTGTFAAIVSTGPLDFGTERAIFLNTENEAIANGTIDVFGLFPTSSSIPLRVEADDVNRFAYEIAGASHLDPLNQADLEAIGVVIPGAFDDSNTLQFVPVIRAVFDQLDGWVAGTATPSPSRFLDAAPAPAGPDPAYHGHPSVIVATVDRDGSLNALGGIRLPNVALGVGQYLGIGPPFDFTPDPSTGFFRWLAGGFVDLRCEPLPDGSARFRNHGDYVRRFRAEARDLVHDGFLLEPDASKMIREAAQSDIGRCD